MLACLRACWPACRLAWLPTYLAARHASLFRRMSAGRQGARRLSAARQNILFICDGQTLSNNATQEEGRPVWTKIICGKRGLQMRCAQDSTVRSQPNFQQSQIRCVGKFLYWWHVCYYHQCEVQAVDRFAHMMKVENFII